MQYIIESALYSASQLFMLPVLLAVILMFLYSFHAVGGFLWQSRQRRLGDARGFDLLHSWRQAPQMSSVELETLAFKRLEVPRIVTRITPMLGLRGHDDSHGAGAQGIVRRTTRSGQR